MDKRAFKIALFSGKDDPQAALLAKKLKAFGVDCFHYFFNTGNNTDSFNITGNDLSLSIRDDGIYKKDARLSFSSLYITGFYEELPSLIPHNGNYRDLRLFDAGHASYIQWHSFDSSFVRSACYDADYVINHPQSRFSFPSSLSIMNTLSLYNAPCPLYVAVSTYKMLSDSPLFEHDSLLFSHTAHGSPRRVVYKEHYEELFQTGRDTMILLTENIKGQLVRLFVLDGKALLALNVDPPRFENGHNTLEIFTKRDDLEQFTGFANGLYSILNLNFFEAELIITDDGDVYIMSVITDVRFISSGRVYSDFIADNLCLGLMNHSSIDTEGILLKPPRAKSQSSKMPYLTRMLKPYYDAFQKQVSRKE